MSTVRWVVPLLLLAWACGGKAGKNVSEAMSGASGASGSPTAVEPTCADTPRSAEDDAQNAKLLEMAQHADPDKLVLLLITLVQVETTGEVSEASRSKQLEPYQAPIVAKLTEWGAQNIERFWLSNSIAASVPLKYVDDLLCLPNVVQVYTDAPYWEVVEKPWSADEAGKYECPLQGERCPEHCFDFNGIPFDEAAGCYQGRERVGCAVTTPAITDGFASCFEQLATGKTYLFYGLPPVEPNFVGWHPCDPALTTQLCGQ
jgi:hypothetical protein